MRLIDADYLKNLPFERVIHTDFGDTAIPIEEIDNAPTIDDLSEYSDKLWQKAYERGKAEARPTEVNCSHCDYFKFSRSFVENIVGFMLEHDIYTVDDLMTELNHINELNRVKDELEEAEDEI